MENTPRGCVQVVPRKFHSRNNSTLGNTPRGELCRGLAKKMAFIPVNADPLPQKWQSCVFGPKSCAMFCFVLCIRSELGNFF